MMCAARFREFYYFYFFLLHFAAITTVFITSLPIIIFFLLFREVPCEFAQWFSLPHASLFIYFLPQYFNSRALWKCDSITVYLWSIHSAGINMAAIMLCQFHTMFQQLSSLLKGNRIEVVKSSVFLILISKCLCAGKIKSPTHWLILCQWLWLALRHYCNFLCLHLILSLYPDWAARLPTRRGH